MAQKGREVVLRRALEERNFYSSSVKSYLVVQRVCADNVTTSIIEVGLVLKHIVDECYTSSHGDLSFLVG